MSWLNLLYLLEITIYNFTDNPIQALLGPYVTVLGGWFYGMFFGMIGAIIYTNAGRNKVPAVAVYLIVTGTIGQMIFPFELGAFFGLIGTFLMTIIIYKGFVVKRQEF